MNRRSLAAALLTSLAVGGVVPGATSAQAQSVPATTASRLVFHYYSNAYGIPSKFRRGGNVDVRDWYMQDAKGYYEGYIGWSVLITTTNGKPVTGVTVKWLNPFTHQWEGSTTSQFVHSSAEFAYDIRNNSNELRLPANAWQHNEYQIAFSNKATPGSYKIFTPGVSAWDVHDSRGRLVPNAWQVYSDQPGHTLTLTK